MVVPVRAGSREKSDDAAVGAFAWVSFVFGDAGQVEVDVADEPFTRSFHSLAVGWQSVLHEDAFGGGGHGA